MDLLGSVITGVVGIIVGIIVLNIEYGYFHGRWKKTHHEESTPSAEMDNSNSSIGIASATHGFAKWLKSVPHKAIAAAIFSLILFGGGGYVYLGQTKKGIFISAAVFVLFVLNSVLGILVAIFFATDAFSLALRMGLGQQVKDGFLDISLSRTGILIYLSAVVLLLIIRVFVIGTQPVSGPRPGVLNY